MSNKYNFQVFNSFVKHKLKYSFKNIDNLKTFGVQYF